MKQISLKNSIGDVEVYTPDLIREQIDDCVGLISATWDFGKKKPHRGDWLEYFEPPIVVDNEGKSFLAYDFIDIISKGIEIKRLYYDENRETWVKNPEGYNAPMFSTIRSWDNNWS